jgi:hypothetical protein
MNACPNKNSKEWKLLVSQVGEDLAFTTWMAYGDDFPPQLKSTSEIRKEMKLPYQISINQLSKIKKMIRLYNDKNGTAHTYREFSKPGDSPYLTRLEPVINYLPANLEARRLRDIQRSEEGTFSDLYPEAVKNVRNVEDLNDFYMGDDALREQDRRNIETTSFVELIEQADESDVIIGDSSSIYENDNVDTEEQPQLETEFTERKNFEETSKNNLREINKEALRNNSDLFDFLSEDTDTIFNKLFPAYKYLSTEEKKNILDNINNGTLNLNCGL